VGHQGLGSIVVVPCRVQNEYINTNTGAMSSWIRIALRKDVVLRGFKVGGIVGTILVAINQGDLLMSGELPSEAAWKIPLTYLVPYCVSTFASVAAIRSASDETNP
jgi:hypothetical protein